VAAANSWLFQLYHEAAVDDAPGLSQKSLIWAIRPFLLVGTLEYDIGSSASRSPRSRASSRTVSTGADSHRGFQRVSGNVEIANVLVSSMSIAGTAHHAN